MSGSLWDAFFLGAAAVLAAVIALWLVSLWKRDVSVIDIFWGPGFVLAAWLYRFEGPPPEPRQWLQLVLVTLWGLRLGGYILWRNAGKGEDYRYRQMREKHGESFRFISLGTVFLLQGTLILLISAPLLVTQAQSVPARWRWSDVLGLVLWLVGFFFEAVGDAQMARFKADSHNRGKVMHRGLWRYTRHPNYFGDACQWWGLFCFALAAPGGLWALPAPVLMSWLLLKVSGVALLEKTITERRPEYREYIETTNAFFPGPVRQLRRELEK